MAPLQSVMCTVLYLPTVSKQLLQWGSGRNRSAPHPSKGKYVQP